MQGFELAYNQRSSIVDDIRKNVENKKEEIANIELKADLSDIDLKIAKVNEDIKILVNLTCIRIESSKLLITKIKGDNKKCTLSLSDNSNLVSKNSSVREISINYPEKIYSKSEFLLNKLKSYNYLLALGPS